MNRIGYQLGLVLSVAALASALFAESTLDYAGVLVLKSGRIAEGRITQTAGGYEVEMTNGRMLVPFRQVQLQAASRRDAYRMLRQNMPQQAAEHHIRLADWCMTHQLLDLARIELADSLRLEPDNERARGLLRRLESLLNPEDPLHEQSARSKTRTSDGFIRPEAKSLAGLSPRAAEQFVTRVQPLLINKCGNTSCHGRDNGGEFKLLQIPTTGGSRRVQSERNLAQLLRQIDPQNTAQSPLLVIPRGTHGRGGRTIFRGRKGAAQMALLEKWVQLVVSEHAGQPILDLTDRTTESLKDGEPVTPAVAHDVSELPGDRKADGAVADLLDQALRDERPDAFDPEIFNRRVRQNRPE